MRTFDVWFCELISNYVWYEPAKMHHKEETFRDVANKVYMEYLASENFPPIQVARVYVFNKLGKIKPDKIVTPWHVQAAINIANAVQDEWKAVSPEERAKRLKEWEDMVKNSQILNSMPKPSYKELAEEGGVLPPKPAPYPVTSKEELYVKQRHFEYIKANFEARTGQKLPSWICEEDWNVIYDDKHLLNKGL